VTGSLLHVTSGDSAGNTLRQTTIGGAVLPWRDVLHEGPVPAGSRASLRAARAAFLSAWGWGGKSAISGDLERRDRQLVDALRDGRNVVLWFEHDLYDQLQLLDVLSLIAETGVEISTLELLVVGAFPGRPGFRGLGELTAEQLESLWPARVPASSELVATAADLWEAVRAPTPESLAERARRAQPGLPFMAPALQRLLEELPAPRDGLSGTERRALAAVAAGADTPVAAFLAAQDGEPAPFLGDAWFFRVLAELGSGDARLVETAGREPLPIPPPLGEPGTFGQLRLRLTPEGRRVCSGEADRVELLGIDRWVGGTHVVPGVVWRWDADASLLVGPQ
jgi:hypothetical protein